MALSIPIISEFDGKGIKKAVAQFKQLETTGQRVGFVLKKAGQAAAIGFAAIGAAAVAAGAAMWSFAKMAMEDQKSQRQLAASIKAVTKATDAQIASTEEWITQTQLALGVADTELRPALGRLVRSTKDVQAAQKLLNVALDVSAATGKPLEAVVNALGKAYDGNNTALARLGLGFSKVELKGMKFADVQERLGKQFGGAAGRQAGTFEGKMARLSEHFGELKETMGVIVLDYLQKLVDLGIRASEALGERGLAGAVAVLAEALKKVTFYDEQGKLNGLGETWNKIAKSFNVIGTGASIFTKTLGTSVTGGIGAIQGATSLFGGADRRIGTLAGQIAAAPGGPNQSLRGAQISINFYGLTGDPVAVGRQVRDVLNRYDRRMGRG